MTRFDLPTRAFTDTVDVPDVPSFSYFDCCIATADSIWIVEQEDSGEASDGRVWRFDIDTLETTDTLELGVRTGGGIAAADAIWLGTIGEPGGRAVYRIDAQTREVTDVIQVRHTEHFAMFDGSLWTGRGGGHRGPLTRIDVDSRQVAETLEIPAEHMEVPPFSSETVMWVQTHASDGGRLFRVDPVAAAE
jgi:hypothetical protein